MRIFSVLCGAGTLFGTWLVIRQVLPGRAYVQLAAMTVVAFNPQFVYLSSVLNSDNLVATIAAFTMSCLVGILRGNRNTREKSVELGALFGLGMLTKPSMAVLALPAIWVLWVRKTSTRSFVWRAVTVGLIAVCVSGWFFARNAWLYGGADFFGYQTREALFPAFNMPKGAFWSFLVGKFAPLLFLSYWGLFGWSTVLLHPWQYVIYFFLGSTAMLSIISSSRRPNTLATRIVAFLWLTIGVNLIALIAFNLHFLSYHGRLMFPTLAAQAALFGIGLEMLWSKRSKSTQMLCATALAGILAAMVVYTYFSFVRPLYFSA